jgi:Glycosyltransferase sugar-binding region containing DXD motif
MIPRKIFTIWLGEEMPGTVKSCIETHKLNGYEHQLITLADIKPTGYLAKCIEAKKWVKAVDHLRMQLLYENGGIYLDADVEVLRPFDAFLGNRLFCGVEQNNFISNAVVGAEPNHPLIKEYLETVESNFLPEGNFVFQAGMEVWHNIIRLANQQENGVTIYPPDVFYPFNHETGKLSLTANSFAIHRFLKSWNLPKVSIVVCHLGTSEQRLNGLQKCLDSIKALNYPKDLIETIVVEDTVADRKGVPKRLKEGIEKATGEYIVYASNDIEFEPQSLLNAVTAAKNWKKALVTFNTGELYPDKGNICEHFVIRKDFIPQIGEVFHTGFNHVGCDNLLWAKCSKLNEAIRCEQAIVKHNHFTKGSEFDDVYKLGWSEVEADRKLLAEELSKL